MRRDNKFYLVGAIILVAVMSVVWFSLYSFHSHRSQASNQLTEKNNELLEQLPQDFIQLAMERDERLWERDNQIFVTDTKGPILLYQHNNLAIYAVDNALYYVTIPTEQGRQLDKVERNNDTKEREAESIVLASLKLYEWEAAASAQVWIHGSHMVIGSKLPADEANPANQGQGNWITIQLDKEPTIVNESIRSYYPEQIWNATFLESSQAILFQVKFDNKQYLRTIIHDPLITEWLYADQHIEEEWLIDASSTAAVKTNAVQLLQATTRYTLADMEQVLVYEDGESTYLQQNELIRKYEQFQLLHASSINRYDQSVTLLGHYKRSTGEQLHIVFGDEVYFPYEQRLLKGDWFMLPTYNFIRIDEQYIHVLNYADGLQLHSKAPTYHKLSLEGKKYIGQNGAIAVFHDGVEKYADLLDLANTATESLSSILSTKLVNPATKKIELDEIPIEWTHHPIADVPIIDDFADGGIHNPDENNDIPSYLLQAINETFPPSDYSFASTIRKINDSWFVLYEQQLYQYKQDKLEEIARLPVTITSIVGEAFGGLGAKDYLQHEGQWYIADTEGNRVIRLNEQWQVTATLATSKPQKLTKSNDQLKITGLTTETISDWNLNIQHIQEKLYNVEQLSDEHYGFQDGEWWQDEETGFTWYYIKGYLHQYNTNTSQHRVSYIGYSHNHFAKTHIWLAADQVIVMLDNQLHRFDRTGAYIDTISYPRVEPDGIYDTTVEGEGTIAWHEESNTIYIVQGYRILAISLTTGEVNTVFEQHYADIGAIHLDQHRLYFMLRSNTEDRYTIRTPSEEKLTTAFYTQLIAIDVNSLQTARTMIDGYTKYLEWTDTSDTPATPVFVTSNLP